MKIYIIFSLLLIVNAIGTFAYGARLAGVRTKSISSSGTLYNILTLFSRTAYMFLLPLIGSVVEYAIRTNDLEGLTSDFSLMFWGITLGTGLSILLIPYMSDIFYHTIIKLQKYKSMPKVFINELRIRNIGKVLRMFRFSSIQTVKSLSFKNIPKGFLILNIFISAIYSVGFLSALYAGALMPEYRLVTSQLSSAINGFATITLYILVDPVMSVISDDTMNGKRPLTDLKSTLAGLAMGRFIGTLFAQFIFIPVAYFIVWVAHFFI